MKSHIIPAIGRSVMTADGNRAKAVCTLTTFTTLPKAVQEDRFAHPRGSTDAGVVWLFTAYVRGIGSHNVSGPRNFSQQKNDDKRQQKNANACRQRRNPRIAKRA